MVDSANAITVPKAKACWPWKASTLVSSSLIGGVPTSQRRRELGSNLSGDELTTAAHQEEKNTASQDQARQPSTNDGAGNI